jgi:membrane protease YdiL (CAAX protease family)
MTRAVAPQAKLVEEKPESGAIGYFQRSEHPLYSLIFLLPLMIAFEVGSRFYPSPPIAFELLRDFFTRLGATGQFIPSLSIIGILLAWHIARKDAWQIDIGTILLMAIESIALAMPLLAIGAALARWQLHIPLSASAGQWRSGIVLYLGAGIYEELVFRLILMTMLVLILTDICKMPQKWSYPLIVVISAVSFSLYHYLGHETFEFHTFVFRTIAGIYFAVLFITRGFGISVGSHVAYDVSLFLLQAALLH